MLKFSNETVFFTKFKAPAMRARVLANEVDSELYGPLFQHTIDLDIVKSNDRVVKGHLGFLFAKLVVVNKS